MFNKFQSLGNAGLIGFRKIQIYISDFEILISANSRQHDQWILMPDRHYDLCEVRLAPDISGWYNHVNQL